MRVGIECQRLLRANKHGMEIVALELIKHLQEVDQLNEYKIFVKDEVDNQCLSESENFKLVRIPSINFADWEQLRFPKHLKKYNLDLLHCTGNTSPFFPSAPTIITLHDIIYLEEFNLTGSLYQNLGNLYRRVVVPKVIHKCDKIITVSEFEKERIVDRFNINENKVKVIYNGVSNRFKVYDRDLVLNTLKDYNLPDGFILFFGNTAPKKNTLRALKGYSNYVHENSNPMPLVITDITERYLQSELRTIQEESILPNIHLTGYFPNEYMPYLYNLAEITLYPSLRESFGLPILESMACGTPVVTSNVSSMPEVAGDAAILVDPLCPDHISHGIQTLLSDSDLYQSLVRKGIERASHFNWFSTAKATVELYNCCR